MHTLFPLEQHRPEGFQYIDDFITAEEESELIKAISKNELHPFSFQGFEARRKVASFGFDWSFDTRRLKKGKEIPATFHFLIEKVGGFLGLSPQAFAELLLTEYPSGSVINWHRDAPPFDIIAGISLLSDCVLRLRPQEQTRRGWQATISFPVRRRSLYVMRGIARTEWQHSIAAVTHTRYSITLRTLKERR